MATIRIPERKKNPGKGAGIRSANARDKKAESMRKRDFKGLRFF